MAITGPIPLPQTGMSAFLDQLTKGQENDYRKALTQQAYGAANQSNMLSNLLNQASGGAGNIQNQSTGQQANTSKGGLNTSNMSANQALLLAGALKLPTQTVGGNLITPFGTFKVEETKAESGQREVGEASQKAQGESDVRTTDALNNQADALIGNYNSYGELGDLLKKDPDLTGWMSGLGAKLGYENKPGVASFKSTAGKLQLGINKAISQRGGVGAFKSAATIKPDLFNQGGFNSGMIGAGQKDTLADIESINDRYKSIHGKNMPQYEKLMEKIRNSEQENQYFDQGNPSSQEGIGQYSAQNLSNRPESNQEGMANVPPVSRKQNQSEMVYLVEKDPKTGKSKKVKMRKDLAEAIVSGKLNYAK